MSLPYRLGLTGSIGMGKSTTAAMFAEAGIPVWDADATVHQLYAPGGAAVVPLAAAFPDAGLTDHVDRTALKRLIDADPGALSRIESIVHPLVAGDRARFIRDAADAGADLVLLDIPLLFETKAEAALDGVLVVSAPPEVQRARVLARPGMTPALFDTILGRQMPDAEKRARADFVIETLALQQTRVEVLALIDRIRTGNA